ncbi:quinon protein alcohol dehydrogenase-like superfamily [Mycena crocata]|nr:quinon protein alcohol dehydrogenase-like superfamily [Mycena crocata]
MLASGGADGVRLWDMVTMRPINGPNGAGNRGKTTALTWIRREDEPGEILVYGTHGGYIVCWRQCGRAADFEELSADQMVDPGEVSGIAFDAATNRLCVCHRKSVVQLYTLDRSTTLQLGFSVALKDCVPKAISFGEFKGNEREIVVFGLYDGRILTLRGGSGDVVRTRGIGCVIGDAVVNSRKGVFCIDDVFEGPALYRLNDEHRVRTFGVESTKALEVRPRQIRFADEGGMVVSGSDHGIVYVFETRTGEILEKLRIGAPDWIQTITTTQVDGVSTILAARARDFGKNEIFVWKMKGGGGRLARYGSRMILSIQCFVVAGFLAFAYEKVTRLV